MSSLLAVDPGLIHPAAAIFRNGILECASRVKIPKSVNELPIAERCREVARLIRDWYEEPPTGAVNVTEPAILVLEWPKVYQSGKSKGDPADILPLACVNGCLATSFPYSSIISPIPSEWIGQLPKNTTGDPLASPRGIRIWGRLSDLERDRVIVSHDSIDSIGLGLFALDRLNRRRVFAAE